VAERRAGPQRPKWLVKRLPSSCSSAVPGLIADLHLNTVCRSANCPNLSECWARGTATFMILGEHCTRGCRFCAVGHGAPERVEPDEPGHVAEAAKRLGLTFVVVTSVTRDDLADGGASQFAATIDAVHRVAGAKVEVLVPDFCGREESVDDVVDARCEVFSHNIETVRRLYAGVRPGADYERSLGVLRRAAGRAGADQVVKSGLMVGFGETHDEVARVLADAHAAGCRSITIGQYLSPRPDLLPVAEYVEPEVFERYAVAAREIGFASVASGPFVRSSYMADEAYERIRRSNSTREGH
jgi:lipoic acid synthetase